MNIVKIGLAWIFGLLTGVVIIILTQSTFGQLTEEIITDSKYERFATTTFASIAEEDKAILQDEYHRELINKLDLILQELRMIRRNQ